MIASIQSLIAACPSISLTDSFEEYAKPAKGKPLSLLKISHEKCSAVIAMQGAQLLEFSARENQALLWLSPYAEFSVGKPVRGGIPVCAPWFGVNQETPTLPKHGLLRTQEWQLTEASEDTAGVKLVFEYSSTEADYAVYPHRFNCRLEIGLGQSIALNFEVRNLGASAMPFSWALHSYHPVADLAQVKISELDQSFYLDNTQGLALCQQQGDLGFEGEIDRVYLSVNAQQSIQPDGILVRAENAPTAIVWNPGKELAENMTDVLDAYNQYVCLERGAAFDNAGDLAVGNSYHGKVVISYDSRRAS